MHISEEGLAFVRQEEGCILHPYLDTTGTATIGYGNTHYPNGRVVTMEDPTLTREQAGALLVETVAQYESAVNDAVMVPLAQNQFDALVSLTWNIGIGAFRGSTLLRRLNTGNYTEACAHFTDWNKARAGGRLQPNAGLTARRAREAALFARNVVGCVPQRVEGSRPLSESTELRNSVATAAIGAASAAAPFVPFLNTLTTTLPWVVGGVIILAAIVGIFLAVRRNREGR